MKQNCNIVRDLLPLYADKICSEESRNFVDEHLSGCAECSAVLDQIRNTDFESDLKFETEKVIQNQAKFFKRKSAIVGAVIAGIFMIPVIVCLIVNLAVGSALDWFFIVLASLLVAASLIVVPLMMPENKALWTLGTFTFSLLLLLGVTCIYAGGNWFFVAATPVLFGFSVLFLPFAVHAKPLRRVLGDRKGLACMSGITLTYIIMMISIGLFVRSAEYAFEATAISIPFFAVVWAIFFVIRYSKLGGLTVTGIIAAIIGVFLFAVDDTIMWILGYGFRMPQLALFTWNVYTLNDNIKWLTLLVGLFFAVIFIIWGTIKRGRKK